MRFMTTPLSGRRAQAARNDDRILEAARHVFVADPSAPIAAVAERAGVGISALYRRYESKEALLRKLCGDGLRSYIAHVEEAIADEGDVWEAFVGFMRRVVDADTHSLTMSLAGTFRPTEELYADAATAGRLNEQLVRRTKAAGVLRDDIQITDFGMIFQMVAAVRLGDEERTAELRHRYLALLLDGLRAGNCADKQHTPLPGTAPRIKETQERWQV
jgi:AcrR family transcriptional regulator